MMQTLYISQSVANGVEVCDSMVPADGAIVNVLSFFGSALFTKASSVKLVWDLDGTPELLWSISGEASAPISFTKTGDGVKKLSVCLNNGESTAANMSGCATIEVE